MVDRVESKKNLFLLFIYHSAVRFSVREHPLVLTIVGPLGSTRRTPWDRVLHGDRLQVQ